MKRKGPKLRVVRSVDTSRARARTTDDQIDVIVKMMLSGEWRGAASHKELARLWSCHPRTVGERAFAAAAIIRRFSGPTEDMVRTKLAELESQQRIAMRMKRPVVVKGKVQLFPAPDVKAANKATEMYLTALGAFNHVKRTQEIPADPIGDDELLEQLTEAIEVVKARMVERTGVH